MDWKKIYVWFDEDGAIRCDVIKPEGQDCFEVLYMESEFDKQFYQEEDAEPVKIDEEFVALRMNRR